MNIKNEYIVVIYIYIYKVIEDGYRKYGVRE